MAINKIGVEIFFFASAQFPLWGWARKFRPTIPIRIPIWMPINDRMQNDLIRVGGFSHKTNPFLISHRAKNNRQ